MPNESDQKRYEENVFHEMLKGVSPRFSDPALNPDGTIDPHFGSLTPWHHPGYHPLPHEAPHRDVRTVPDNTPLPPDRFADALYPQMPPLVDLQSLIPKAPNPLTDPYRMPPSLASPARDHRPVYDYGSGFHGGMQVVPPSSGPRRGG